ncbi:MAG: protein kinase, partial [Polyangiaceae bacterium]|nr:protein kinase [Polyangiaceae bacterium]
RIGRRVAIKFILPQHATSRNVLRRFENEARAAGPLDHENIAAVHDFGAHQGERFLVMDLLQGEDCARLLRREGTLPVTRAVNIVLQACRGLDVAHRAGIVHRDLKPANLFATRGAEGKDLIKVLDFGIAKLRNDTAASTLTGGVIGTPHYMSPEQARGDRGLDARTDIYALGVILYELIGGRMPHQGSSKLEIIYSILHRVPEPLDAVRPGLPAGLSRVVATAMSFDPAARHPTVAALCEALVPFAGPGARASTPVPTTLPSADLVHGSARHVPRWPFAVTAGALALGANVFWLRGLPAGKAPLEGRHAASATPAATPAPGEAAPAPPSASPVEPVPDAIAATVAAPPALSEHGARPNGAHAAVAEAGAGPASAGPAAPRRGPSDAVKRRVPSPAEAGAPAPPRALSPGPDSGAVDIARDPNF